MKWYVHFATQWSTASNRHCVGPCDAHSVSELGQLRRGGPSVRVDALPQCPKSGRKITASESRGQERIHACRLERRQEFS
jgi:hypothetical protein